MSFPSESSVLPKPVVLFFVYLAYIKFAFSFVLYYVGLDTSEPLIPPWEEHMLYFPETDSPAPSAKSPAAAPSSIKKQLPVVEFSSLVKRCPIMEDPTCVICLGELEAKHKVRELGNCGHGFHVQCIDSWVDVGQVTCPLCRAGLLSSSVEKKGKWGRFLWVW